MLSPEITTRLETARQHETSYQPNEEIGRKISEKTLVMFVSPAAGGKSFLMNHVAEAVPDFSRVPVFTTREPREDDEPGMFRYISHDDEHLDELLGKIERREVAQYVIHPTTGNIYGSEIRDYPNKFNMLPTLSSIVGPLKRLPFKNTVVVGIAAEPEIWKQRFDARYPEKNDEYLRRRREAITSLDWLLTREDIQWVNNTSADPAAAVQSVVDIVKYSKSRDSTAQRYAIEMRTIAENL
jgi:energy-coupling factor transporter ATP-binding protein EcfA2